jgi:hypothetical protein
MATNPYFTQYHTQKFSLIGSPQQRNGQATHDQRFLNMYPELIRSPISDGKKYYLKKRPGTALFNSFGTGTNQTGQGIFYWQVINVYFTAVNGVLYSNSVPLITLSSTTATVGFCEFRGIAAPSLIVLDGTKGYIIASDLSWVQIVDPNFPTPHIPSPVFIDGYIFVAQRGTQRIFNSTLLDPNTWPTDGFIDAEMFPDTLQTLTKAQNYLAAVGTESIEFFYDNANATGSPLQRNAPAVAQFGTPAPLSVVQTEKEIILIGQTGTGGHTVWVVDGFQPTEIAQEPQREALDDEGGQIIGASGFVIQCAGHKWYVMNLILSGRTFVYDFDEQMWHEWSFTDAQMLFNYKFAADSGNGRPVLLSYSDGVSVTLDPNIFVDYNPTIPAAPYDINCAAITVKIDFDTIKRKRFFRLSLIGDAPDGDINVPIMVYWSDDDYTTWSAGIPLQINGIYPTITQLGYARRRAFQFQFRQPFPLRLEAFELDIIEEVRR